MPTLEIRRHSLRKYTGGSQLSQAGVELAARVGQSMGDFAVVAASVVPRARETAVAMGYAVDFELVSLCSTENVYAELDTARLWESQHPFAAIAGLIAEGGAYHRYAHSLAAMWRDLLTPLADDERALVIGHSGELEIALTACLPEADHRLWGDKFGHCEGARISFEGGHRRFRTVEFLRVAAR